MPPPEPFNQQRRDGTFRQYEQSGVYSNQALREHDEASLSLEHREQLWQGGVFRHVWSNPLFLRALRAETAWLAKLTGNRILNFCILTGVGTLAVAVVYALLPSRGVAFGTPPVLIGLVLVAWLLALFLRPAMLATGLASLEELRLTPLSPVEIATGMLWGHAISLSLPFLAIWPGLFLWGMLNWAAYPYIWMSALAFGPMILLSNFAGSAISLSYAIAEFCNPMQHVRSIAMTMFLALVLLGPLVAFTILFEDAGVYLFTVGYAIITLAMASSGQQQSVIHLRFRFQ